MLVHPPLNHLSGWYPNANDHRLRFLSNQLRAYPSDAGELKVAGLIRQLQRNPKIKILIKSPSTLVEHKVKTRYWAEHVYNSLLSTRNVYSSRLYQHGKSTSPPKKLRISFFKGRCQFHHRFFPVLPCTVYACDEEAAWQKNEEQDRQAILSSIKGGVFCVVVGENQGVKPQFPKFHPISAKVRKSAVVGFWGDLQQWQVPPHTRL